MIDFLESILYSADRNFDGKGMLVEDALTRAADLIESGALTDRPRVEAAARTAVGVCFTTMGRHAEARAHLERALEIRSTLLGEEHTDTLETERRLAWLDHRQGLHEAATRRFEHCLAGFRAQSGPRSETVARTLEDLAMVEMALGRMAEAEERLRASQAMLGELFGADSQERTSGMSALGQLLLARGEFVEAEEVLREAHDTNRRVLGHEHAQVGISARDLSSLLARMGRYDEALPFAEQALAIYERAYGRGSVAHAAALYSYGEVRRFRWELEEAERAHREAIEVFVAQGDECVSELAACRLALAWILMETERLPEALELLAGIVDSYRSLPGAPAYQLANAMSQYGEALGQAERFEEAEEELLAALEICGPEHPSRVGYHTVGRLVALYEAWGRPAEAARWKSE